MVFKVGDVVRGKGMAGAPEMVVVLEEENSKVTCNWDHQEYDRHI